MVTIAGGIILAVFVLWMISLIQNTMRDNALRGRGKVGVGFIVAFGITVCAALLTLFMR